MVKCTGVSCNGCPYNDNYSTCTDRLKTDARELIIKQEQEIERLTEERNKLSETLSKYIKASDKEIVAQVKQAKIEVLNKLKDYVNQLVCDEYGDSACDTTRSMGNETNQSVKSERHNYVGILGDNSRMCRSVLEAFSDCGTSNIYLHRVDVCGVRRSNGRTEYLVDKTS